MPFVPVAETDPVTTYLAGVADPERREALAHVYAVARSTVPATSEGVSYGMPCLMYAGKALLAAMDTARHLAIYPYSGAPVAALGEQLAAWSTSPGTIRFQPDHPLPDALLAQVVQLRQQEIDERAGRGRR